MTDLQKITDLLNEVLELVKANSTTCVSESIQKDNHITHLTELVEAKTNECLRLEQEAADFLKVSYTAKWKKQCEDAESEKEVLQHKLENEKRFNKELNFSLDKLTEENNKKAEGEQTEGVNEEIVKKNEELIKTNEKLEKANKTTQKKNRELTKSNKSLVEQITTITKNLVEEQAKKAFGNEENAVNTEGTDNEIKLLTDEITELRTIKETIDKEVKTLREALSKQKYRVIELENINENNYDRIATLEVKLGDKLLETTIKTQKGAIYILKDDKLEKDGKVVGEVVEKKLV
tara:strand:+ start:4412 stop:5287 length:876 start_codon:yes stop_codon:yes gene_type:complete